MSHTFMTRRATRRLTAALVAAVGVLAACNDSTAPDHEEDVAAVRLAFVQNGAAVGTYTVSLTQAVTPSPFRIPVGTSTVAATFLNADGATITIDPSEHALSLRNISPANAFTFTSNSAFLGTVVAPAAGTATMTVCVTHGSHCDFERQNVAVTIGS